MLLCRAKCQRLASGIILAPTLLALRSWIVENVGALEPIVLMPLWLQCAPVQMSRSRFVDMLGNGGISAPHRANYNMLPHAALVSTINTKEGMQWVVLISEGRGRLKWYPSGLSLYHSVGSADAGFVIDSIQRFGLYVLPGRAFGSVTPAPIGRSVNVTLTNRLVVKTAHQDAALDMRNAAIGVNMPDEVRQHLRAKAASHPKAHLLLLAEEAGLLSRISQVHCRVS